MSLVQIEAARDQNRSGEHRGDFSELLHWLAGLFHSRQRGKPVLPIELTLETLLFITLGGLFTLYAAADVFLYWPPINSFAAVASSPSSKSSEGLLISLVAHALKSSVASVRCGVSVVWAQPFD